MQHLIFVGVLAVMLGMMVRWGFVHLPHEQWQILASVPRRKLSAATWNGVNLTFYGLISAAAYTFATAILILLLKSAHISLNAILILIAGILGICVPASRWIARWVEKKSSTFTVGGASFTGIVLTPVLVVIINSLLDGHPGFHIPVIVVMAGLATVYCFGEGLGRLACISFGCCYGKRLSDCPFWIQRIMKDLCFIFYGKTKKIAYSHGLDGQKVIPVQAMTCIIFCITGLAGLYLFLEGWYRTAFLMAVIITQTWRFVSELLRADYRGEGNISVYQMLSGTAIALSAIFCWCFPKETLSPNDLWAGLTALWDPTVIIFLQMLFISVFLYMGRSQVTAAVTMHYVVRSRV